MDNKDKSKLESLYESVLIKEQYHIHDLPFDQQVAINTLIDNGFKISGYINKNGQRILKLRKLGIDASVDHEGFVNDESVDEFLKKFTPSTTEQPLRGLTNREVERDIAAQKAQRGEDGYAERRHEHGALHGDKAYNEYRESLKIPHGIQAINESNVVKAKVVRKPETDEFVVKVYIDGKYDEDASYYTNDKLDAFATKKSILNNFEKEGYIVEESTINEAKKKVNPWAIEKSIEKKTGKHFGKKHKEEIVKGIKKSAKKAGKKITSDKVKSKKKVVKEGMYDPVNDIPNLQLAWETLIGVGAAASVAMWNKPLLDKLRNYFTKNKNANNIPISDDLKSEVDILKANPKNHIAFEKVTKGIESTINSSYKEELDKKLKDSKDPQILKAREELEKLRNPKK